MTRQPLPSPSVAVRRIVACGDCGARRRTLVENALGLRAHCIGCGTEVAFPFATERTAAVLGRGGQVLATA